jgi:hypothetical protein
MSRPHILFCPAAWGPEDPSLRAAQSSIGASLKKGGRILRMPLAFSIIATGGTTRICHGRGSSLSRIRSIGAGACWDLRETERIRRAPRLP